MSDTTIQFPADDFKDYINFIHDYCKKKEFSLVLKGSLAKGTAKKNSDIDLVMSGLITNEDMDNIISGYNTPLMTNFTENPKGIFILIYKNGICVDLDVRNTFVPDDLDGSIVLAKYESNFIMSDTVIRKTDINSKFLPSRPDWYKVLRLVHRGLIKFLCGKPEDAFELISEIKESLDSIDIKETSFSNNFKDDVIKIFRCIDIKYDVGCEIRDLFDNLLNEL